MWKMHKYKSWQLLQSHVDVIDSWPRKVHKVQVEFMVLLWINFPHTSVMNQYHACSHDIVLQRSVGICPPRFHDGLTLFATMGAQGPYCKHGVNL